MIVCQLRGTSLLRTLNYLYFRMADDDVERLRELENAMGEIGGDAVNGREPLDDQPNDDNGMNQ